MGKGWMQVECLICGKAWVFYRPYSAVEVHTLTDHMVLRHPKTNAKKALKLFLGSGPITPLDDKALEDIAVLDRMYSLVDTRD